MDDHTNENSLREEEKIDKTLTVLFFMICATIGYALAHFL
jgi:hypothetical protein